MTAPRPLTTLRREIAECMASNGESWADTEATTLTDAQLDARFPAYGVTPYRPHFTVWTARRVYFPVAFDGDQWVDSVARHPDGTPTLRIGNCR